MAPAAAVLFANALNALLAEQGTFAANMDMPCQLVTADADAGEISLAENVVRVALQSADQSKFV
ncbi:hypothetical protein [Mesorhizobium sp.]|uniref:hypothetical protein n=1 Tax=Mesorhizobium sp. TaxID=1871066 RepID=UPI000FE9D32D|nr:hypothetical protein [Mesorhizobium sp.]RWE54186.1 MAG: hypothetical protein EOS67_26235 [Mesorhizobium sp.]